MANPSPSSPKSKERPQIWDWNSSIFLDYNPSQCQRCQEKQQPSSIYNNFPLLHRVSSHLHAWEPSHPKFFSPICVPVLSFYRKTQRNIGRVWGFNTLALHGKIIGTECSSSHQWSAGPWSIPLSQSMKSFLVNRHPAMQLYTIYGLVHTP